MCRDDQGDPSVRRVSRFTTLHSLHVAVSRSSPVFSTGDERNRRCSDTLELSSSGSPRGERHAEPTYRARFGSSARERRELDRARVPSTDADANARVPKPLGPSDRQRPFARVWIAPTRELGTNDPGQPRPPAESFETRRSPSISANRRETRAHPRAIRVPARRRLASYGGWPRKACGRRAKAEASPAGHAAWDEHAHGCAEARTNRRRAPLVAAGNAERRLENRRRHDPGQDRLRNDARTCEPKVRSRCLPAAGEPGQSPNPRLPKGERTHFSRLLGVFPRRVPATNSGREPRPG
jgi:hypothetical protein